MRYISPCFPFLLLPTEEHLQHSVFGVYSVQIILLPCEVHGVYMAGAKKSITYHFCRRLSFFSWTCHCKNGHPLWSTNRSLQCKACTTTPENQTKTETVTSTNIQWIRPKNIQNKSIEFHIQTCKPPDSFKTIFGIIKSSFWKLRAVQLQRQE